MDHNFLGVTEKGVFRRTADVERRAHTRSSCVSGNLKRIDERTLLTAEERLGRRPGGEAKQDEACASGTLHMS